MIKRDKRNIGKIVKYVLPHPRADRQTKITGFRGDHSKNIPYVTTSDGNTTAAHLLKKIN